MKGLFLIHIFFIATLSFNGFGQTRPISFNPKIEFWDTQKKGTNFFNAKPTSEWFESAAAANIKFIRFTYAKWEGEKRDFLLGDADNFIGIVEADFRKLLHYLNIADSLEIKVVLTPISLPGARWVQNNNGQRDGRLWTEDKYQEQAAQFWQELAKRLKNHPAIVGYNIKNEPHPEVYFGKHSFWDRDLRQWYQTMKGSPADLNRFYKKMVSSIREVDSETPIILESGLYATPWAFDYLEKIDDPNIIYSFHMYEPYNYTTFKLNNNQYNYPGTVPVGEKKPVFNMDKNSLKTFLEPVNEWAVQNKVPSNQIWAGEFGCSRKVQGAANYLSDLIEIFNEHGWHWSFYSFREDVWDDMDYELGTEKVNWKYWEYAEKNILHEKYMEIYGQVKRNSLWQVIEKELSKQEK